MATRTKFTLAVRAEILRRLAKGDSLRAICRTDGLPCRDVVNDWLMRGELETAGPYRDFLTAYDRAKRLGLDEQFDELLEIADDSSHDWMETEKGQQLDREHVRRSEVRINTRKWRLEKLEPTRFGPKVTTELSGPNGGPIEQVHRIERVIVDPIKPETADNG